MVQYEDLVQRRQEHIGRYFWRAHRAFVALSVRKLAERGHTGLGMAHTTLIAHLDTKGTRITTLVKRMGITKQAASRGRPRKKGQALSNDKLDNFVHYLFGK